MALKSLIERYQKLIFNLILHLAGCDRQTAFTLTISSFVESIRSSSATKTDGGFLQSLLKSAIYHCRNTPLAPAFDPLDLGTLAAPKKESLRIVREGLSALSFGDKSLLLLRDQNQLPYTDLSAVLGIPKKEIRSQVTKARIHLMDNVREIL